MSSSSSVAVDIASFAPEVWTASSNDALTLSLAEEEGAFKFHPAFTYPIFGDAEQIFGYQDLKINLAFDSTTLLPFLNVSYSEKLPNVDIEDPEKKLMEYLPESTILKDESKWVDKKNQEANFFKIPGELIKEYKDENGEIFSIYKTCFKDDEALKLHLRMQIFVLFFIEAGSYIDKSDLSWELYFLYKTSTIKKSSSSSFSSRPSFVGFCTAYSYFRYPGFNEYDLSEESMLDSNKKISQFVVLPPYQQKGHGKHLYNAMVDHWLNDKHAKSIAIEDPNESFDDLRDRCDLERLHAIGFFEEVAKLNLPISKKWLDLKEKQLKLDKRQLQRCCEMALLYMKKFDSKNPLALQLSTKKIRLQIKKRLYIKNKDALLELDKPTRLDKLQTAYERLEEDYLRILEKLQFTNPKKRTIQETSNSSAKKTKS